MPAKVNAASRYLFFKFNLCAHWHYMLRERNARQINFFLLKGFSCGRFTGKVHWVRVSHGAIKWSFPAIYIYSNECFINHVTLKLYNYIYIGLIASFIERCLERWALYQPNKSLCILYLLFYIKKGLPILYPQHTHWWIKGKKVFRDSSGSYFN